MSNSSENAGSPRSFRLDIAQLYRRYASMVLRRVLRFYARDEAEEIVHEIFLRVVERGDSFREEASPATWLYRVTTNHCLNRLRDEARRRELWRENQSWSAPSATVAGEQETAVFLREFWRELDAETVTIAAYYFADGLSHDEIAGLVGCARRTVGNRLEALRDRARSHARSSQTQGDVA